MASKRPAEGEPQGAPASFKVARENGYQEVPEPGQQQQRVSAPKKRGRCKARDDPRFAPIIYRETDPLPGIQGLWQSTNGEEILVEVLIGPEYVSRENKRVKARQIWGDLVYTPDSDIVAVLMHLGYYAHNLLHPPNIVVEVRALIRLLPPRESYPSRARFLKSREWSGASHACSYQVERCWMVTRTNLMVDLAPCIDELPAPVPTVQPQTVDRQVSTRNTGSKVKQCQEVSVQYNLCNEPWLKYTLAAVADKGFKRSQWTSARLVNEVLYLETASQRYQIARIPPFAASGAATPVPGATSGETGSKEQYTLSRCKAPLPCGLMRKMGIPLPAEQVEVLHTGLDWEEFKWGVSSLHVRGTEIALKRMNLLPVCMPGKAEAAVKAEDGMAS